MISRLRSASLLALGVLGVHELRYAFGYGADAGRALSEQGHGYLGMAFPVLLAMLLAAAGSRVVTLLRRGDDDAVPSLGIAAYALILLAAYSAQELTEGWVAAGHPAGLAALLGHGGWIAAPLAAIFGALCWMLIRWFDSVERAVASVLARRRNELPRAPRALGRPRPARRIPLFSFQLAFGIAGRAPPRSS